MTAPGPTDPRQTKSPPAASVPRPSAAGRLPITRLKDVLTVKRNPGITLATAKSRRRLRGVAAQLLVLPQFAGTHPGDTVAGPTRRDRSENR